MKKSDVSTCFQIPMSELECFEQEGLFNQFRQKDGELMFQDQDIPYLSQIVSLKQFGFTLSEIKRYMQLAQDKQTTTQRIEMLRKQRSILLDRIHEQQKCLDDLDCLIYQLTTYK